MNASRFPIDCWDPPQISGCWRPRRGVPGHKKSRLPSSGTGSRSHSAVRFCRRTLNTPRFLIDRQGRRQFLQLATATRHSWTRKNRRPPSTGFHQKFEKQLLIFSMTFLCRLSVFLIKSSLFINTANHGTVYK